MSLIDSPVAVPVSRLFPLQDMSAGEIAARIAARDIPAAEIVEHFIARLKAVNTRLNAVTVELFDSARKTAAKFDDALLRGEKLAPLAPGSPALVRQRRRLLADGRGDGPLPARLPAIARYRRRRPDRFHSLPGLCGAGAAARCEPDDAAAGRLRPARPGHRSSRRHRAGHARSSWGRERPPGEPRSGRARRPRERARERRSADCRAGDRPAVARSRRACGDGRNRGSREKAARLSGAAAVVTVPSVR